MRIIAGRFKGFEITTPKSGTRPTTDRTKEAIFSHLTAINILPDARVLDLFAGTGALGIEALSRGARSLVAVESAGPAAAMLGKSFARLKSSKAWESGMGARVVRAKAERYVGVGAADDASRGAMRGESFDLVLIDPPYAFSTDDCNALTQTLVTTGMVDPRGVIMLERSARSDDPTVPEGWEITQARKYGETAVFYFERRLEE
ncbi:16S rRNA (guanine(966)-N(2))-methyltransferase RsmD [Bifidobacterium sp. 82T24]|uniref:16S rRNA (guanine(966)-N(2))-methyltransferase RsmD n=1 Tax=Bifidobacterium pluvialisilvae TaxID=2834436 RepID=UPI001C58AC10|nr:16S rRNA (guanine(966)-N(2))-methyltransferase RsmD [Bifidobacterium pluvialisilvae]MBW3088984.1 16S rRNA (guanine(966)-N(2))-methyltransferase RsmD [Bifidobacterium pluvialisilvae]